MTPEQQKIEEVLNKSYTLDLGHIFERGFAYFQSAPLPLIAFTLIYLLGTILLQQLGSIGAFAVNLAGPPLLMGAYVVLDQIRQQKPFDNQTFLAGFQTFTPLVIVALFSSLVYLALVLPLLGTNIFSMSGGSTDEDPAITMEIMLENIQHAPTWAYLSLIPLIYLGVSWFWAPLFVYFFKLSAFEALETSRKIITKQWGMFALLFLIFGILFTVGLLFLGVGVLVAMPVIFCLNYAAFEGVMELGEGGKEEEPASTSI